MIECKHHCHHHLMTSKIQTYRMDGCYCTICEYYFKEKLPRCPCCNSATRQRPKSNRRWHDELPRVVQ